MTSVMVLVLVLLDSILRFSIHMKLYFMFAWTEYFEMFRDTKKKIKDKLAIL